MRQEKHRWSELEHSQPQLQLLPGIEVMESDWERSHEPLVTLGVAGCVALVAYNETTRTGMLGHFGTLSPYVKWGDSAQLESARRALDKLGDRADTEVLLLGASPYFENDIDTLNERSLAEDQLLAAGWVAECNWSDRGSTVDIRLDTPKGLLQVVDYHYENFYSAIEALRRPHDG
jgi:hypothetical protein